MYSKGLTENRINFIKLAFNEFPNGLLSKKDIDFIALKHGINSPQWLYNSTQYRTARRGVYQLPNIDIATMGNALVSHSAALQSHVLPIVHKSDDEILAEINQDFKTLAIMAESVKNGQFTSLIVSGTAGSGKSHTIDNVLGIDEKLYYYVKGKIKPVELYRQLYIYRHKKNVIIVDDSDELFEDNLSLNIIKHALDSKENRIITWGSEYEIFDNNNQLIPRSFNYRGSMIFITNKDFYQELEKQSKIAKHIEAFLSRSHYVKIDLDSTKKQILHTFNVLDNNLQHYNLNVEQLPIVKQFILDNAELLREITPRMLVLLCQLINASPDQWQTLAKVTLCKKM